MKRIQKYITIVLLFAIVCALVPQKVEASSPMPASYAVAQKAKVDLAISLTKKEKDKEVTKKDTNTAAVDKEKVETNPSKKVPLYNQLDYTEPYGDYGSIATHGCGPTCIAMVASYIKETDVSPVDIATQFGDYNTASGSLWSLLDDSAVELGLKVTRTENWSEVKESLKNGKIVISLQFEGLFTSSGHFIVLTGINESGKITVNDPYGANWERLKTQFATGFSDSEIQDAGGVYWIYRSSDEKAHFVRGGM